jgi:hypothetical protein
MFQYVIRDPVGRSTVERPVQNNYEGALTALCPLLCCTIVADISSSGLGSNTWIARLAAGEAKSAVCRAIAVSLRPMSIMNVSYFFFFCNSNGTETHAG